jgi:hypothetical protein
MLLGLLPVLGLLAWGQHYLLAFLAFLALLGGGALQVLSLSQAKARAMERAIDRDRTEAERLQELSDMIQAQSRAGASMLSQFRLAFSDRDMARVILGASGVTVNDAELDEFIDRVANAQSIGDIAHTTDDEVVKYIKQVAARDGFIEHIVSDLIKKTNLDVSESEAAAQARKMIENAQTINDILRTPNMEN